MKLSQLFTKTRREAPRDEEAISAQLLLRAGFVHKQMAGAYVMLPLGLKTLNSIIGIIREEMNAAGGQELTMTALQPPELWQKTNRWDDKQVDVWFRTKLHNDTELGLGFTHEEPLTELMAENISSYRDLPQYVYQFQAKFRNEVRAKSGIMRTREFIMKDLYSFSRDQKQHDEYYEKMKEVYTKVFQRLGIGDHTFITFASGGSFSKYSHEFQAIIEAGEDVIYLDRDKKLAVNEEVYTDEVLNDLGLDKNKLEKVNASEVGNIFTLGTKFSDPLGLKFTDEDGSVKPVIMGSYGIGPARVMGVLIELFHDDKGMIWPEEIAPAKAHIVRIGEDEDVVKAADKLYADLKAQGIETIYDDRDIPAGAKFADADLMGMPVRLTVSPKTLKENSVEVKRRNEAESKLVSHAEALKLFK
ncbi:prolyl-tRNA synthetase [Patescibacteria group bacterium]|nr:MAG: prolyl-tRNA synthetase [Patescibacteria group bacterium]